MGQSKSTWTKSWDHKGGIPNGMLIVNFDEYLIEDYEIRKHIRKNVYCWYFQNRNRKICK